MKLFERAKSRHDFIQESREIFVESSRSESDIVDYVAVCATMSEIIFREFRHFKVLGVFMIFAAIDLNSISVSLCKNLKNLRLSKTLNPAQLNVVNGVLVKCTDRTAIECLKYTAPLALEGVEKMKSDGVEVLPHVEAVALLNSLLSGTGRVSKDVVCKKVISLFDMTVAADEYGYASHIARLLSQVITDKKLSSKYYSKAETLSLKAEEKGEFI